MDVIENRLLEVAPRIHDTIARLERTGVLSKLSFVLTVIFLLFNIVLYLHLNSVSVEIEKLGLGLLQSTEEGRDDCILEEDGKCIEMEVSDPFIDSTCNSFS